MNDIERLQGMLRDFATERDWHQFHSPKNLVMALVAECGELSEIYQWQQSTDTLDDRTHRRTGEEMADIAIYLLRLADVADIDLIHEIESKIESNAVRYPVDQFKGSARKYND